MTDTEDAQKVYAESAKYGEWEVGDLLRTMVRIELATKKALQEGTTIDPRHLAFLLEIEPD